MLYQINATRTCYSVRSGSNWTRTNQIPTFYLDSNMQGIVDAEHAEKIARRILGVGDSVSSVRLSVQAEPFVSIHD